MGLTVPFLRAPSVSTDTPTANTDDTPSPSAEPPTTSTDGLHRDPSIDVKTTKKGVMLFVSWKHVLANVGSIVTGVGIVYLLMRLSAP